MPPAATVPVLVLPAGRRFEVPQRDFFEIAPGEFAAPCPVQLVPRVAFATLIRHSSTHYEPVLKLMPTLIPRRKWDADKYGCSWYSAVRLALAGFVMFSKPSPRTMSIILESFLEHRTKSEADPWFWTPERLKAFDDVKIRAAETVAEPDDEDENEAAETIADKRIGPRLAL